MTGLFLISASQESALATESCNDMGFLDYSCEGPDDCEVACFYIEGVNCTWSSSSNCGTTQCSDSTDPGEHP